MSTGSSIVETPAKTLPPLSITKAFEKKTFLVIGGTGFLGKIWLSLLLDRYPDVEHIYLMVRPKDGQDALGRFQQDILPSPVFDPLREKYSGDQFVKFFEKKVSAIPGDIKEKFLGLKEELIESMKGHVAALVNVAGLVDFNPPLDEALSINAFGTQNLVSLAKHLGNIPIFHTSTCYVAGNRTGLIPEEDPREFPFPRADELDRSHWSPAREIAECVDLVETAKHRCEDAFRQSAFLDEAKQELKKAGEPTRGKVLEEKLKQVKRRFIRKQLAGAGLERANFWGWPNTYTYTKSIGEQILVESGLPVCLCRPSIVETTIQYPFVSWNEGINTSTPIIMLAMKGHIQIPSRPEQNLDLIPVDMVASGMIAALAALLEGRAKTVYHLASGDLNPCTMDRMIELVGLAKRKRFRKGRQNPIIDFIQSHIEPVPVSKETYNRQGAIAITAYAKKASILLRKAAIGPAERPLKSLSKAVHSYSQIAGVSREVFDVFMPFIHDNNYEFRSDHIREIFASLEEEDQKKLFWYPEKIEWRHYFHEVHIPALEKWVEDDLDEKFRRVQKPVQAHENLWEMLEELHDRHNLAPALQQFEENQLWRISYHEFYEQALACATRLFQQNILPNDRVILSAKNHPFWPIAYFGILRAGATVVPVDPELEPAAIANIIRASCAKAAIFDTHVMQKMEAKAFSQQNLPTLLSLQQATAPGETSIPKVVLTPEDIASLIFTSGTTGTPKGVMLSHKNFVSLLASLTPTFPLHTGDSALSVLPLHHTFEFTCGLLLPLSRGARVTYLDELTGEKLLSALKKEKVTAMIAVPALWQMLERRITSQITEKGVLAKALFDLAIQANRTLGKKVGLDLGRVLFGPVHQALGGNLRYLVSGGAALPEETHKLFAGIGLHLAEGYGLTEAAPVLTVTKPSPKEKPGHVGTALPGVQVKIEDPDEKGVGEILASGDNVMSGYADNEEATRQTITEDGWLRTGDLGKIDRHGKLQIVGRAKEVIVSATGENVYPDDVEALLGTPQYIQELSILGIDAPRGGERVACLASPLSEDDVDRHKRLVQAEESLRNAIRELPASMRPAVVQLYEAELPKTATRKVKRKECKKILQRILAATESGKDTSKTVSNDSEIQRIVASVAGVPVEKIIQSTHLDKDLGFDSLMRTEIVAAIDSLHQKTNRPPVDGQKVLHAETFADLTLVVSEAKSPSKTKKILDDEEKPISLPEPVRDTAKTWMRQAQMGFYRRVMKTRVTGRSYIPQNRNCLVVSNHSSHLDLGAIKYALGPYGNDLATLGAKDYFFDTKRRARHAYFENLTNVVPIDRQAGGKKSLEGASKALAQGKTLLMFPEGTRSTTGLLADFKPGIGYLTLERHVDILPVYVSGSFESLPKGRFIPSKRDILVRIGPPLLNQTLQKITRELRPENAARAIALAAQKAVEALRDGKTFDLSRFDPNIAAKTPKEHPMQALFSYVESRFSPDSVEKPTSFYFSLGEDERHKWSVLVRKEDCKVHTGKPEGGQADCVVKTNPAMMEKIIRNGYVPDPSEFINGTIKTNNLELLQSFVQIFNLSKTLS